MNELSTAPIEGLRRAVEPTVDHSTFAALTIIAIMALVFFICLHLYTRKRLIYKKWGEFIEKTDQFQLAEPLQNTLLKLAACAYGSAPGKILKRKTCFERAVHIYRNQLAKNQPSGGWDMTEKNIHELRAQLNWEQPFGEDFVATTRQIQQNTRVCVFLPHEGNGSGTITGWVRVNSPSHLEFALERALPGHISEGSRLAVSCEVNNQMIKFSGKVGWTDSRKRLLHMPHTLNITDISQRKYERVEVRYMTEVAVFDKGNSITCEMEITDISPGGVALLSAADIFPGTETHLFIAINPEAILEGFTGNTSGCNSESESKIMAAQILSKFESNDGRFLYRCRFKDTTAEDRISLLNLLRQIRKLDCCTVRNLNGIHGGLSSCAAGTKLSDGT